MSDLKPDIKAGYFTFINCEKLTVKHIKKCLKKMGIFYKKDLERYFYKKTLPRASRKSFKRRGC